MSYSQRQWSRSDRHILGMSWPCILCPKGDSNVPEVGSSHVSSGELYRQPDLWCHANQSEEIAHCNRGAHCESTAKSLVIITSCSQGCCWAGWPHARLFLRDKPSWLGATFNLLPDQSTGSPTHCVLLYVLCLYRSKSTCLLWTSVNKREKTWLVAASQIF